MLLFSVAALPRREGPVPVRHGPLALGPRFGRGGDFRIQRGFESADLPQNVAVEPVFREGSFAPRSLTFRLHEVHVIQSEGHRPQDEVDALQQDVFLGIQLRDVVRGKEQAGFAKPCRFRQGTEESLELLHFFAGVRELVKVETEARSSLGGRDGRRRA